jgi:signal recognition particle subunit SEC65
MGKKSGGVRIKQVGGKAPSKAALAAAMQPPKLEDFMIAPEDQITLPAPTNKKYQIFFPIFETFTMQTDTFQIIYPNYIDPTKTVQQGRRIAMHILIGTAPTPPATKAISPNDAIVNSSTTYGTCDDDDDVEPILLFPTVQEISMALQALNIRHVVQPYRCYSRADPYENPGRCLVDVKSHYQTKQELLVVVAQQILSLSVRHERIERERVLQKETREKLRLNAIEQESAIQLTNKTNTTAGTSSNTTTSTTNKKKSAKKRK